MIADLMSPHVTVQTRPNTFSIGVWDLLRALAQNPPVYCKWQDPCSKIEGPSSKSEGPCSKSQSPCSESEGYFSNVESPCSKNEGSLD